MMNNHQARAHTDDRGFTLVEVMAVVVIIGLLAAATTVAVMGSIGKARKETTRTSIQSIANAAERFKMDTGRFPKRLEHLVEKPGYVSSEEWGGEYLKSIPEDGWGNEFKYEVRGGEIMIKSHGADNQPGGNDDNADITLESIREKSS